MQTRDMNISFLGYCDNEMILYYLTQCLACSSYLEMLVSIPPSFCHVVNFKLSISKSIYLAE